MKELIFILFLLNFIFFMLHEIDGAYWKEWKFFGRFGSSLTDHAGLTLYLLFHIPIFIILFYGILSLNGPAGMIISILFSGFMIFHFIIHSYARMHGSREFEFPVSFIILFITLIISLIQFPVSIYLLYGNIAGKT